MSQDPLGTAECRLGQVSPLVIPLSPLVGHHHDCHHGHHHDHHHEQHNLILSSKVVAAPGHQKELFLSPHKTEPGDCGVINVRSSS